MSVRLPAPSWQVARLCEQGRLRRVLAEYEPSNVPINALYERARRTSLAVRSFLDFVIESGAIARLDTALKANGA